VPAKKGIRYGYWMPVFGGWLRNVEDEQMQASWQYTSKLARRSEEIGFDLSLIAELNMNDIKGIDAPSLDAWSTSAALAAVTKSLELMVAVRPTFHLPALFAKQAANIDHISGGRLALNVVSSWWEQEAKMYGVDFERHDDRYGRTSEWLDVVNGAWSQKNYNHKGRYYNTENTVLEPKPLRAPRPPIYAGGESEAAKNLIAQKCDAYVMHGDSPEHVAAKIADMSARREKLGLEPQRAIVTSAGTLYPFMREKITQVFGCKVYNLYGSREVSDIACELPCADDPGPDRGHGGLCVAPWGNYVEILDDEGKPVPPGEEGNIAVTSLTNYAMPLVRYWIGDRGALMPESEIRNKALPGIQVLKHVSGRNVDVFRTRDQTLIDGEYFTHLLYFRPWVWKFQVIQKSYEDVLFRVVRSNGAPPRDELEEIAAKARLVQARQQLQRTERDQCRDGSENINSQSSTHKYKSIISNILWSRQT